jgi:hypothetical protein
MRIILELDVTEYQNCPPNDNTINLFEITEKCLTIKCCNDNKKVLFESEISIEDARKLAQVIINNN